MSQDLEIISRIQKNDRWLESSYPKVQEKYENKFIAVEDKKIIAYSDEFEDIIKQLKDKGKDPALILIELVPRKGIKIIL